MSRIPDRPAQPIRLLCVLRVIKFALPLAAMFCFGALGPAADAAGSKKSSSKKSSSSASAKKSSGSKKSAKSKSSAKSSKSKSKQRSTSKAKEKSETAQNSASLDWIDDLPEVELPEASGPPEDELLEPVPETPAP
jgi:hypothetical protein